jgi:hypothetical protein
MSIEKGWLGIVSGNTNPKLDADVIMTAAVVGHACARLQKNQDCAFDAEVYVEKGQLDAAAKQQDAAAGWIAHVDAIARINKALNVWDAHLGVPGAAVIANATPEYDVESGQNRIVGGGGNRPLTDSERYVPKASEVKACVDLYNLLKSRSAPVGYQGSGAYTGFVERTKGAPAMFWTYRHFVEAKDARRWLPADPKAAGRPAIGPNPDQCFAWGLIGENKDQPKDMYFYDQSPLGQSDVYSKGVLGYTHGLIQAIYDVAWSRLARPEDDPGVPFEIAVGDKTTKLASCLPCALFMEANGFPASATHLGRGDSWCPSYADDLTASKNNKKLDDASPNNLARVTCNADWAKYCKQVLELGMACLEKRLMDDHQASLGALHQYLQSNTRDIDAANLILDALTVHDQQVNRINRTLESDMV